MPLRTNYNLFTGPEETTNLKVKGVISINRTRILNEQWGDIKILGRPLVGFPCPVWGSKGVRMG